MKEECASCCYWDDDGLCQRFPVWVAASEDHWCGEYIATEEQSLKVIDHSEETDAKILYLSDNDTKIKVSDK